MHHPVEIALCGIPASGTLERYIGSEARKLDQDCNSIQSCHLVAEALPQEKRRGAKFAVRLIITLPGTEVVVNREHDDDLYLALRDAFAAAGLQLKGQMCRRSTGHRGDRGLPGSSKDEDT